MSQTIRRAATLPIKVPPPGVQQVLIAALVVWLCTSVARAVTSSGDAFSLVCPAAGIGFALIRSWRTRGLIALALGTLLWAIMVYWRAPAYIPWIVVSSCAGPAIAVRLLDRRFAQVPEPFAHTETLFAFLLVEAFAAVPASAAIATVGLVASQWMAAGDAPAGFVSSWIMEFCGAVTFAPFVYSLFGPTGRIDMRGSIQEVNKAIARDRIALSSILIVSLLGVLTIILGQPGYGRAALYVLLPLLAVNAARTRPFAGHFTLLVAALAVLTTWAYALHASAAGAGIVSFELSITALYLAVCGCTALILLAISSERRIAIERLEEQAFVDPVTKLFNEAGLRRSLARAAQNTRHSLALVGVHLINEPAVEQLLGGEIAQEIIRRAGTALDSLLAAPTWGRVASGRFVGIVSSVRQLDALMAGALAIVNDASRGEGNALVRPVWGVSAVRGMAGDHLSGEALLAALREAEEITTMEQGAKVLYIDPAAASSRRERTRDAERVREAVASRRIVLFGQMIRPNRRGAHHHGASLELLVKLRALDGELIDAPDWLPLATRQGLMPALDTAVIETAFQWFAGHRDLLWSFEYCGINLSGSSMDDPDLVRRIAQSLRQHQLPADKFMFEVTEGQTIFSPIRAAETIRALRRLGCRIAIDDFGTGLATFDYLKRFEFDCIKIDGAFIQALGHNPIDEAVVSSIVTVARAIAARTVAEYVTTDEILAMVTRLGVDASQGWAIGVPVPLDQYFGLVSDASLPPGVTHLAEVRSARGG